MHGLENSWKTSSQELRTYVLECKLCGWLIWVTLENPPHFLRLTDWLTNYTCFSQRSSSNILKTKECVDEAYFDCGWWMWIMCAVYNWMDNWTRKRRERMKRGRKDGGGTFLQLSQTTPPSSTPHSLIISLPLISVVLLIIILSPQV